MAFAVMAADLFVGPPPLNPDSGHQVSLDLVVDVGSDPLGSYFFRFQYDPAVVHVAAVLGGGTPEFSAAPTTDPSTFASGSTPLAAAQGSLTTPQGFVSVARVTLLAVGLAGDSSNLDAQVDGLFDTQFNSLPSRVFPSSVLINVPEVASDLRMTTSEIMAWTSSGAVTSYNVYRGTFDGGRWSFDHTCMNAGIVSSTAFDTNNPRVGTGFYYLVSGVRNIVEGTLGSDSTGAPRPNAFPCGGTLLQITAAQFTPSESPNRAPVPGSRAAPPRRIVAQTPAGDVEQDGYIDNTDAQRVLEALVGTRVLTAAQRAAADVDSDGDVDVADAQRIKQYVLGSIPALTPLQAGALAGPSRPGSTTSRKNPVRIIAP